MSLSSGLQGLSGGLQGLAGSGKRIAAWSPTQITSATLKPSLQVALSKAQGKLWQDAGKTVAATANNDPVRVATCPFTGSDYVAPSAGTRPLLTDLTGGKWGLTFDGVDDVMACVTAITRPNTYCMGVEVLSNPPSNQYLGDGGGRDDDSLQATNATTLSMYNGAFLTLTVTNMANVWRNLTWILNSASSSITSNAQTNSGDAGNLMPTSTGVSIGGPATGTTGINAIFTSYIVTNGVVTGADLTNLKSYTAGLHP